MGTSVALPPPDNRGIAMTRACHGRSGRGGLCPQHPRQLRCPSYGARRTNNGATRGSGKAGPHTPRIRHHKVIPHHPLIIGRRVSRGTTLGNTRPEGTPPRPCRAHNGCGPTQRRRYPPESLCLSHGRAHARGHDGGPAYGHMSHGPRSHPKGLHSKAQRSVGQTQGVPGMPRPLSPTLPAAQIRGIAGSGRRNGGAKTGGDTPSSGLRKGCAGTRAAEGQGCIRRGWAFAFSSPGR